VLVEIDTLNVLAGRLPSRARKLVEEWASLHQDELRAQWERAVSLEPLQQIDPLP
jgi:hypothetical protein